MSWWVGDIEIDEAADDGAFRQARRSSGGRPVVVRVVGRENADAARREADLSGAVDHDHVAKIAEVVEAEGRWALVLAPVLAFSLSELVEAAPELSAGEIVTALAPVAGALAAIHAAGLTHGDVCPEAIWFEPSGRPMLTGLGRTQADLEAGGSGIFHPASLAPERARDGAADHRSDLFGLGSTLLTCLTGRSAWPADNVYDVLVQSTVGQWPDAGLDDSEPQRMALAVLARRLLDANPERRGTAREAARDLGAAAAARPVIAPPALGPSAADPEAAGEARIAPRAAAVVTRAGRSGPAPRANAVAPRHAAVRRGSGRRPTPPAVRLDRRWWRIGVGTIGGAAVLALAIAAGLLWAKWTGPPVSDAAPAALTMSAGSLPPWATSTGPPDRPASVAPLPAAGPGWSSSTSEQPSVTATRTSPSPRPTTGAPPTTAATADWTAVMNRLDQARAAAIVSRDTGRLSLVYTAGSVSRAGDLTLIRSLLAAHTRVKGAAHHITRAAVVSAAVGRVRLTVTDSLPAYPILDEQGQTVGMTAGRAASNRRVDLSSVGGDWRIVAIGPST